jgi:catechol 2,3-dioxygenase-like lactoylglutathione lyase family enzyme
MIAGVESGVRDLADAERFYAGVLGVRDPRLRLVEAPGAGDGWVDDDRQLGLRHLAFYVGDVDAEAARLREAGVEFTIEPRDATGDVRLAFFHDPDGTLLELLSGPPAYHRTHSPALAARERAALPRPGEPPRLAHLAITVAEPPHDDRVGELFLEEDGMVITFVDGPLPLELFSFPDGDVLPAANSRRWAHDFPRRLCVGASPRRATRSRARSPRTGGCRRSGTRSRTRPARRSTATPATSPTTTTTAGARTSTCSAGSA